MEAAAELAGNHIKTSLDFWPNPRKLDLLLNVTINRHIPQKRVKEVEGS